MIKLCLRRYSQWRRVTPPSSSMLRKKTSLNSFPGPLEGWALVGVCPAELWAVR